MKRELIQQMQSHFDSLSQKLDDGTEFWYARDLQKPLGYTEWRNFLTVIARAIESCETANFDSNDHFVAFNKLITHGKGGQREIEDFMLTRYACYLIAQNGDPQKESEKTLSRNIYERGVDSAGFGRIRSKGDAALFGGHTTQEMKTRFGIPQSRPLADFLPTLTIAAKSLATEMTNHNVLHPEQQERSSNAWT